MNIGKIQRLALNEVFPNEAKHFTPWLEKNLDKLSEVLGFTVTPQEREMHLNSFFVDIVAQINDEPSNKVVIENQFGASNHDHLGKILTYASTVGAKAAVWIVEEAHIEHINAVNELNKAKCADCGYYLVEAQALKVDDSKPAILFNVIAKPEYDSIDRTVSNVENTLKSFWRVFIDKATQTHFQTFSNLTPPYQHWIDGRAMRKGAHICVSVGKKYFTIKFIFDSKVQSDNKDNYHRYLDHKDEIEALYGETLEWREMPDNKTSMVSKTYTDVGGYDSPDDEWDSIADTMIEKLQHLSEATSKFVCLIP